MHYCWLPGFAEWHRGGLADAAREAAGRMLGIPARAGGAPGDARADEAHDSDWLTRLDPAPSIVPEDAAEARVRSPRRAASQSVTERS
jgi:hypothetical protein